MTPGAGQWLLAVLLATMFHLAVLALVLIAWAPTASIDTATRGVEVSLSNLGNGPEAATSAPSATARSTSTTRSPSAPASAPSAPEPASTSTPKSNQPAPETAEASSANIPTTKSRSNVSTSQPEKATAPQDAAQAGTQTSVKARPASTQATNQGSRSQRQAANQPGANNTNAALAPGSSADSLKSYTSALSRAMNKQQYYPKSARQKGLEGHATVRVVIAQSGKLLAVSISESSGHDSLDQAAIAAVKRAAPFATMPSSMQRTRIAVAVPFNFELSQ